MAARSLIQLFRTANPELLHKKDRVRPDGQGEGGGPLQYCLCSITMDMYTDVVNVTSYLVLFVSLQGHPSQLGNKRVPAAYGELRAESSVPGSEVGVVCMCVCVRHLQYGVMYITVE